MHETTDRKDELHAGKLIEILRDLKHIGVQAVTYSGGGEPLMHPEICTVLRETLSLGLDLSILTNGQRLNGEAAQLVAKGKWLRLSIDYWSAESFQASRGGSHRMFEELVSNIRDFAHAERTCELGVNFIITRENHKGIVRSAEFLCSLGVENVRYSPVWVPNFQEYHSSIEAEVKEALSEIREKYGFELAIYDSYRIGKQVSVREYTRCYFQQVVPVIGADGNVYSCHNKAYDKDGVIGSITDKKFSDLWFSEGVHNHFINFRPDILCNHQCANDRKNVYLNEIMRCYGDNYV